jgi:hypothetical protein
MVFGDIGIGQTAGNEANPFRIAPDSTIAFGEPITFTLELSGANGYAETLAFTTSIAQFADVSMGSGLQRRGIFVDHPVLDDTDGDGLADAHWVNFFEYALHRNAGDGSFVDVTSEAGLDGMAGQVKALPIVLDIDNDGDRDLFIAGIESQGSRLFVNLGDGTFEDASSTSGVDQYGAVAAVAIDFDNDGFVDIFGGINTMFLLKNNGDGTFSDVLEAAGLPLFGGVANRQLVAADFDGDRDTDLLVPSRNLLFRNDGDGTFTNVTATSGIDSEFGSGNKVYGIATGDVDNDGDIDLLITGYGLPGDLNRNRLYRNDGGLTFSDVTASTGDLALGGLIGVNWGNAFFDYDNDGDLDLHMTNEGDGSNLNHLGSNTLYRNDGAAGFTRVTEETYPAHIAPSAAGATIADIDADGTLDIWAPSGFLGFGGRGALLANLVGTDRSWIRISLRGTISNADAYGARVTVTTGDLTQIREVNTSPVETQPLHFGLGDASSIDEIVVRWPSGVNQRLTSIDVDRTIAIVEADDACIAGGSPDGSGEALEIDCNAPETITPIDTPISFTPRGISVCDDHPTVVVTAATCTFENPAGKTVGKRESCVVHTDGTTIEILGSGGVKNRITWTVSAEDVSGNVSERRCELDVVKRSRQ